MAAKFENPWGEEEKPKPSTYKVERKTFDWDKGEATGASTVIEMDINAPTERDRERWQAAGRGSRSESATETPTPKEAVHLPEQPEQLLQQFEALEHAARMLGERQAEDVTSRLSGSSLHPNTIESNFINAARQIEQIAGMSKQVLAASQRAEFGTSADLIKPRLTSLAQQYERLMSDYSRLISDKKKRASLDMPDELKMQKLELLVADQRQKLQGVL